MVPQITKIRTLGFYAIAMEEKKEYYDSREIKESTGDPIICVGKRKEQEKKRETLRIESVERKRKVLMRLWPSFAKLIPPSIFHNPYCKSNLRWPDVFQEKDIPLVNNP